MELKEREVLNMEKMTTVQARNLLHDSKNQVARSLLGRIATCTDVTGEVPAIHNDIEKANKDGTVTQNEYLALTRLCNDIIIETNAIKFGEPIKQSLVSIFKNRIWSTYDLSRVLQFRNSVTEMLMLDFINLDEYIELSNEVDKYIQYTLSNGGIK